MHQGELGANCGTCHTQRSFVDLSQMRRAHQATSFPLTGLHAALDCRSCHTPRAPGQMAFLNRPSTCESCHLADYQKAANPPHTSAGFPKDCSACHSSAGWRGTAFAHATTMFPLTGAHRAVACVGCHGDNVYRGKPTACVSCHQANYNQTKTPPHAAAGFPTTCETCHNTTAWPGTFDHTTMTTFPLTGAHRAATCANCHADGVYKGKPTTCVSCHLTNYNATTNPNHTAVQFPTDCASCHTTTTWLGAKFNHDAAFFPIYSGRHATVWSSCATCHTNPANYAVFDCLSCHTKSQTDAQHRGRAGYVYASPNCYACHPRGST
jgi:hypothetical protein